VHSPRILDGRYRLDERLGAGGMSVVWRGTDLVLRRPVAVKVLASDHAVSPAARRRIQAEARAAAQLSHPHVTGVFDYGETDEGGVRVPYVVMELLPGRTLAQRLADGPLPPRQALRVLAEVADALAAAHARDLVHRDVKPSNVMLTPSGAKVLDFGIAAVVGREELEAEGLLLGTPAYLAPERLTLGRVSPASDVYALGLLVHRALTDRLPWLAETTTRMIEAHRYVDPDPLPPLPGVPPSVNAVCDRCLAKDPAARPTAAEVAAVLAEAAGVTTPARDDDGPASLVAVAAPPAFPEGDYDDFAATPADDSPDPRIGTGAADLRAPASGSATDIPASASAARKEGPLPNAQALGRGPSFAAGLPRADAGDTTETVPAGRDRRRRRALAGFAAVVVVIVVAVVALVAPDARIADTAGAPAGAAPPASPAGSTPGPTATPGATAPPAGPGGNDGITTGRDAPATGTGTEPESSPTPGGGPGGGSGTPSPVPPTPTPTPGRTVKIISLLGTEIEARCVGDDVEVLGVTLLGYRGDHPSGPRDTVTLTLSPVLDLLAPALTIRLACRDGQPVEV